METHPDTFPTTPKNKTKQNKDESRETVCRDLPISIYDYFNVKDNLLRQGLINFRVFERNDTPYNSTYNYGNTLDEKIYSIIVKLLVSSFLFVRD